jgi:signal transduction histidine kinase
MDTSSSGKKRENGQRKLRPAFHATLLLILLLIAGILFPGLASGTCEAATGGPEVRVGSELDFPPYAFVDDRGQPAGFSVDLIKAVAKAMGLPIRITTGPWDTVWNDLVTGRLDVLPIVAKSPERQRLVDFSLSHTETFDAFFVRQGNPVILNLEAAKRKEIVMMRSDAAHHELLERHFPGHLILVDNIPAGLSLVASGKHDAFLCSKLIGVTVIKKKGLKGLTAGPPIPDYKRVFSFAVKKGDPELLEKLNQGLLIIKTSGEYERIYEKWLTGDDPWRHWQKYLRPAIAIAIIIVLVAGFWLVMLQLLVKKRTRQLIASNEMLRQAQEDLAEKVAQRTAELEHANRELESFSYSVSHDLKSPLRAIQGFSRMLAGEHAAQLDTEGHRLLTVITENTKLMHALVDDLLALSRLGRKEIRKVPVNLSSIAGQIFCQLRDQAPERDVQFSIGDLPPAHGDPSLLNQVLENLFSNAIKYTKPRQTACIEMSGREDGNETVYYVKDNGVGFDARYADKLFGVFQRLHGTAEYEGTGVGLAIVQRIIHRHHGRVWAEGKVGEGATFYFALPKNDI